MSLHYKINVLSALKDKGYTTYRLSKEKILSHGSVQKIREGEVLSTEGITTLCKLLNMQPSDFLIYVDD